MSDVHFTPRLAARMDGMKASEIRELLKLIERPDVTSFAGGIPDPVLFPRGVIAEAYAEILADEALSTRALQYSVSEGDPDLRAWIVEHMAGKGVACSPENILITSGSQQALEFLGKLLLSPNDTALVAAPTYLGALQAFSAYQPHYDILGHNRTTQSFRDTAEGDIKFAYVVPDFANPSGETMTLNERQALLAQARELDIPILEDSPYSALRYDGEDVTPLQALDIAECGSIDASCVIHCGSFSKVFTPGLRVGWVCASRDLIERLTLIKQASDLNSPAINQAVMLRLAAVMFGEQVTKARAHYRVKRDAMLAALEAHMPAGAEWSKPEGGLFIWMTLPEPFDAAAFMPRAVEEAGIAYVPGQAFFANGGGKNTLRLSFSLPSVKAITEGIARFGALLAAG